MHEALNDMNTQRRVNEAPHFTNVSRAPAAIEPGPVWV